MKLIKLSEERIEKIKKINGYEELVIDGKIAKIKTHCDECDQEVRQMATVTKFYTVENGERFEFEDLCWIFDVSDCNCGNHVRGRSID